jgi:uncharacterized protein (TIGR01777 family)
LVILHKDDLKKIVLAISVLITGASGLVGSRLTELLLAKGYKVTHLGRTKKAGEVPSFVWDVDNGGFDGEALQGIQAVVHLAGAGVADRRWTKKRKKEILESRTKSSALLREMLKRSDHEVRTVVSASAIGYYGSTLDSKLFKEEDGPGDDYLAGVVAAWEGEVDRIVDLGIRVVKVRTGIVLSSNGGVLREMARPIRLYAGSPLGTGNQIVSWIHIDDLCGIFIKVIEDQKMAGAYNAVAPMPATNREMTKAIAETLHRPLIFPAVPGFLLRILLGEMADAVVKGSNVSSGRIEKTGFHFRFPDLHGALRDCLIGAHTHVNL